MAHSRLQKSALPKEVLNPLNAMQEYTLRMYPPSAALSGFVDHYWVMRWDRTDKPDFTCEVIPSPYINLTFMPGGSMVTGITTGKYSYQLQGAGTIFGIKFLPGGFHAFWPHKAAELTDRVIPSVEILEQIEPLMNDQVLAMKTDKEMITRAEALLIKLTPVADEKIKLVNDIIASIDNPKVTVALVAERLDKSERWLQGLFREYVGVGLKWIILRLRLLRAAEIAVKQSSPNWTIVATELGYADQSHFVNDFKRIIGKSPTQYAAMTRKAHE